MVLSIRSSDQGQFRLALLGALSPLVGALLGPWLGHWQICLWGFIWLLVCRNNYILHNHIHVPLTSSKPFNRLLGKILGLSTGMPPGNWLLMHKHGHHAEHKIQSLRRWRYVRLTDPPDDAKAGIWHTLQFAARKTPLQICIPVGVMVGMLFRTRLYRRFALFHLVDYALIAAYVALLFALSPYGGYAMVIIYLMVTYISISVDYVSHAGETMEGEAFFANACYNPLFNRLFWNFGYHAAHHVSPSTHWSELPRLEEKLGLRANFENAKARSFLFFSPTWFGVKRN